MNFDKRDELFAELALDKVKRDKHIQHLSKTRKRLWPLLLLSSSLALITVLINLFTNKVELLPMLLLINSIAMFILAMNWESEIRTLKLVGAMQETQQTKVYDASL